VKIGVAYIYLDFKDQSQQTTENLIGAIVKQLLWHLPKIPERIEEIWRKLQYQRASIEQTTEMFCEACKFFEKTYICFDALDESRVQRSTRAFGLLRRSSFKGDFYSLDLYWASTRSAHYQVLYQ